MLSKVFKTGNQLAITLPEAITKAVGIQAGDEVWVELDRENQQVFVRPVDETQAVFARQVTEFIDEYRPALEALAKQRD